jgi:hypothetical protein
VEAAGESFRTIATLQDVARLGLLLDEGSGFLLASNSTVRVPEHSAERIWVTMLASNWQEETQCSDYLERICCGAVY